MCQDDGPSSDQRDRRWLQEEYGAIPAIIQCCTQHDCCRIDWIDLVPDVQVLECNNLDHVNSKLKNLTSIASSSTDDHNTTNGNHGGGPVICLANGLWADKQYPLKPSYQRLVERVYKAQAKNVDFVNQQPKGSWPTFSRLPTSLQLPCSFLELHCTSKVRGRKSLTQRKPRTETFTF